HKREPITPVRTSFVQSVDFPVVLQNVGTVTAYNTVNVLSQISGKLVKILFKEGQEVKAGSLLAVVDPRPYTIALEQAKASILETKALLKNADIDLRRYKGLFNLKSIAKQTLDTQQALVDQYHATLDTNQADINSAKLNLEYTNIRAPISGQVGIRQVDLGNFVSNSDTTPLVVITQLSPISLVFTLPESHLPEIIKQFKVDKNSLKVEAWTGDNKKIISTGTLESIDSAIDADTGTIKLKARFENKNETLYPNQFVNVHLYVKTLEKSMLVPNEAIQYSPKGPFVYTVDSENKRKTVHLTHIKQGLNNNKYTVIDEGLSVGDQIVTEGTDHLKDNGFIRIVEPKKTDDSTTLPVAK
ncbi:UNVERIFIED_CONTAM: hypothetical protein GTU68_013103, partial [Idotea baltica]|nr:hypothetical protein [Idotea baltica]